MGKRITSLQTASSVASTDYFPIDGNNGTKKVSAGFLNDMVTDVTVDGTSVVSSGTAAISLSGKQDTLIAGTNITIAQDGKTISATDTTYSDMVGAGASEAGTHGLVPAPASGDNTKFLRGDGTWQDVSGGGGSSTLAGLTDVSLSSPTDGQGLIYNATNQEWVNGNVGGGGSSTLSGLTDTDITTPTNGQALVYNSTSSKWENSSVTATASVSTLTDVTLSSVADGQILKYNATSQKWVNANESGGGSRTYLGQLISRVNAADSHITASSSNNNYLAWGAFNGTSPSSLSSPESNSCWLPEANLTNQYIQYHFDAPRYFTKININCFSNYSADWVGDIKVEGSSDGSTWTNILASGDSTYELTADLQTLTNVEINLNDSDMYEYIRVTFVDEMSVAYQPSCFVDEIYVYGGVETTILNYSTSEQNTGLTWIDGKPIFQKTIYYAGPITSHENIDNSITTSNTDYFVCTELSYVVNNSYRGSGFQIEVNLTSNGVIIDKNNAPVFTMTETYATVRYTKASS